MVVIDRTEYDFAHQQSRREDPEFGRLRHGFARGFHFQVALAVDREFGFPLALSDVFSYSRGPKEAGRNHKLLELEQKESRFWVEAVSRIAQSTAQAEKVLVVADAELDFFPFLSAIRAEKMDFLVRLAHNRILLEDGEPSRALEKLALQPELGRYAFELRHDGRKKRTARKCQIALRTTAATIGSSNNEDDPIPLWLVEAKETDETVPEGEKPICWRFLTSRKVETEQQCREVVRDYQNRWLIEQLFRTTKQKGFAVESSQVSEASALRKLIAICLQAAIRVMQLVQARDWQREAKAELVFSKRELVVIELLLKEVEGKTAKQKNPYPRNSLQAAIWVVARIGGWHGLPSQHKPGPKTMKRGLERLEHYCKAYEIFSEKDVYRE